jgi:PAS domain S-box-containing protein
VRPESGLDIDALTQASAESLAANLLELAYDAIVIFSLPASTITYWNAGAERIYGWKSSDALGRRPGELLHSEFDVPRADVEAEVIREGRWAGGIRQQRRDGTEVVVDAQWVLLHDASGAPSAVVEINRDVTSRQKEAELNAAKTTLLDLASDAIFAFSIPEMAITYWSAGATRMYGWSPEEAIGKHRLTCWARGTTVRAARSSSTC